jgi:hypothetical protein
MAMFIYVINYQLAKRLPESLDQARKGVVVEGILGNPDVTVGQGWPLVDLK